VADQSGGSKIRRLSGGLFWVAFLLERVYGTSRIVCGQNGRKKKNETKWMGLHSVVEQVIDIIDKKGGG